jgi:hypothetical protein
VAQRLLLVEEIGDSIAEENGTHPKPDSKKKICKKG